MPDFADQPAVRTWLGQFSSPDQGLAKHLLRALILVSHREFEDWTKKTIRQIIKSHDGPIVLLPILSDDRDRGFGSEDRIGHVLTAVGRQFPRRVKVGVDVEEMRRQRVRHIILVDDLIGSGQTLAAYLKTLSPSIKSWISSKHCKLWVVTYGANQQAIAKLTAKFSLVQLERFCWREDLKFENSAASAELKLLSRIYGHLTGRAEMSLGFGDVFCNLVFEHGCPNNCPAILWADSKKWKPLFPNRSIPPELTGFFGERSSPLERLWTSRQYRLALGLLERIERGTLKERQLELIAILGFMAHRMTARRLAKVICRDVEYIGRQLSQLKSFGLLNSNGTISLFGKDVLERFRYRSTPTVKEHYVDEAVLFYYPQVFQGIRRDSR